MTPPPPERRPHPTADEAQKAPREEDAKKAQKKGVPAMPRSLEPTFTVVAQLLTSTDVRDWLVDNTVVVVLVVTVLAMLIAAHQGNANRVTTVGGLIVVPVAVLAFAVVPDAPAHAGRFVAGLFGLGG
ncbi:hypothetical protein [Pseudonocardia sp. TRM90224]|uniref:hypothetical protein n=1 Tax=Pseudonocardia sp. TRM90224 TaxID=2812678 RepID=UPI001E45FDF9|nr:hypothetical protein [Pseudonocardia sp. TRM90224]